MKFKNYLRKNYPDYSLSHRINILTFGFSVAILFLSLKNMETGINLFNLFSLIFGIIYILIMGRYLIKFEKFIDKNGNFKKAI
jgi:hypothetical protein